jgi:hypothetical protein
MIVGVLRNSLRSLARRPGKTLFFLIIIPSFERRDKGQSKSRQIVK